MGSAASTVVKEKLAEEQAEDLVNQFQMAVMRAAGIQELPSCNMNGICCPNAKLALKDLFDQADINHDGKLDQNELVLFVDKLNFEVDEELKRKLKENMKILLLSLPDDSFSILFDQFIQNITGNVTSICPSLIVSKDPKRVVFVGATGCGKSSLCTALTGHKKLNSPFKIGNHPSSETTECKAEIFKWFGEDDEEEFMIIDTPGLDDEKGRDDLFINDIIDCMRRLEYVNSIVLVVNGENLRFSTSLQYMIKQFEKAFTPRFYDHSIICLTKWYMDEISIEDREEAGKTEEAVSQELIKKICESPNLMCKGSLPVLFVDSFYERRDPKNGKNRLRKIKDSIGNNVFRTADLTKLKPRIIELTNTNQLIRRLQPINPILPHLFDTIETLNWECRPPLPEGLTCCSKKGKISGASLKVSPLQNYQIFAQSVGGWSDGFSFSLEINYSESDIKGIILNSLKQIQDNLEILLPLEGSNIPKDEDACKRMIENSTEKSNILLEQIIETLKLENDNISTFNDVINTLRQEVERKVMQMQNDFLLEHQKQLGALRLRLKAEKDLEIQLIRETTNYEAMINYIRAAEVAGANSELLGFARTHLDKITPHPCKYCELGCGVILIKQPLELHESICIFGLPLFGKKSIQIKKSNDPKEGVLVKAISGEGISWNGKYVYDPTEKYYYCINREKQRIQGLKKADPDNLDDPDNPWVFFSITEKNGPETIVFSSTNSSQNVLDSTFDEFTLNGVESYCWSDVAVPESPHKSSLKILYFGGKWCPYCPPFTAKLSAFFKSIRSQKGDESIDVIFISSDRDEVSMFEYYSEEHGDWLAMPYSERDKKELLSTKFEITGIPGCVIVNNKMEVVPFQDIRTLLDGISMTPGPKQNNDALRIYEKMLTAVRSTDNSVGEIDEETVDIFCSLRFAEALTQAKQIQKILRDEHNLNAVIVSTPQGEDIAAQVATLLDAARMVLIFGTETYGKGTVNFSTKEELQFVMDEKKPFFLIKMCERFAEPRTRLVLSKAVAYFPWLPQDPLPPALISEIIAKYEDSVLNPDRKSVV